jgi:hypothetical protein
VPASAGSHRAHRSPAPGPSPRGYGQTGPWFGGGRCVAPNGRLKVTPWKDPVQDPVGFTESGRPSLCRSKIDVLRS